MRNYLQSHFHLDSGKLGAVALEDRPPDGSAHPLERRRDRAAKGKAIALTGTPITEVKKPRARAPVIETKGSKRQTRSAAELAAAATVSAPCRCLCDEPVR